MKTIQIQNTLCILYVHNQERSTAFYSQLLGLKPLLEVPGMTEFQISKHLKLGLMPNDGIAKIIEEKLPHPSVGNGIPRCELYWYVDDIEEVYKHASESGAMQISPLQDRDWGDRACYFADPDGHVIAFAKKNLKYVP